ncbi:hypothetical protein [Psittacicella hinzii]|uniref:hypothetical protein n=1 Tax=Psittacicella hinzii TaxID=2028575 RepID=UPI0036170C11
MLTPEQLRHRFDLSEKDKLDLSNMCAYMHDQLRKEGKVPETLPKSILPQGLLVQIEDSALSKVANNDE